MKGFSMKKVSFILIMSLVLFACSQKAKTVKFGIISTSINHLPLSYAMDNNLISIDNLELVRFSSGWELSEALIHGKVDLGILPFTYIWTARSQGYKVQTISSFERETDALVTTKGITEIEQLNNQKIGVLRASSLEALVLDLAEKYALTFEIVAFRTPNEMIEALKQKQVDAIAIFVPLVQKISEDYHVVKWFSELYPEHTCCNLSGTEAFIENNDINDLLAQLKRVLTLIEDFPDDFVEYGKTMFGLTDSQIKKALEHTKYSLELTTKDKDFEESMMQKFKELNYLKIIPENVYYE